MIVGAIDIGTNTVRLLVAEKISGYWNDMVREMEIARLGEDVNRTGCIRQDAMDRTLAVLKRYKETMDKKGVERYRAVATSAMRDAENSQEFIAIVKKRLDLKIEVISGEEEGKLTFSGATGQESVTSTKCNVLVVDVGGGSTEFIYGHSGEVIGSTSVDIGSVRLTERFFEHDPPTKTELSQARRSIAESIVHIMSAVRAVKPTAVIAVAGTATQLSALNYAVEPYDPKKIHGSLLSLTDLEALSLRLATITVDERKELTGMHPKRADVIIAGTLILEETLLELGFPVLVVSEKDILDGVAYSIAL